MKDEIKEILDILTFNKEDILNRICIVEDFVSSEQIIKLLDYITNLQTIEQQYSVLLSENAELENRKKELEQINEEINFELRNKCRAMREIKSEILEIIEKELKGE